MIPEKQRRFLDCYQGSCKGRYHIAYLTILGIAGGEDMKKKAQAKYGRENYAPEKMYPLKEAANFVIFGIENGISADRIGRMVAQSYKRAMPDLFKDITHDKAIDLLLLGYSSETDVGNMLKVEHREPGLVRISRKDSVQPCDFFAGVIRGGFEVGGLEGEVREIQCQWNSDSDRCVYEVKWKV